MPQLRPLLIALALTLPVLAPSASAQTDAAPEPDIAAEEAPAVDDGSWVGEDPAADPDAELDSVLPGTPPVPQPAGRDPQVPYGALIASTARRRGVPVALFTALVWQESAFRPRARSRAGARGLAQLMPATARWLGVRRIYDPAQNLDGGARFLGRLLTQFRGSKRLALAGYNAGPGAVKRFGGVPPYPETRRYVVRVLAQERRYVAAGVR